VKVRHPYESPTLELAYGTGKESSAEERASMRRDRGSALKTLPLLSELLATWPLLNDMSMIFLSGSVVQGWGHANSDLDYYVFSDEYTEPDRSVMETAKRSVGTSDPYIHIGVGQVGSYRADVEFWTLGQVQELVRAFEKNAQDYEAPEIGRTEQDMLYRLSIGRPLRGHETFNELRDNLLSGYYRHYVATARKMGAESTAEDVAGLLESGDDRAAAIAAQLGLLAATEAALAVHGDWSVNRKWLARRIPILAAHVDETVLWEALAMRDAHVDPRGYAERTLRLTTKLISVAEGYLL
jgi:hypothetical protein